MPKRFRMSGLCEKGVTTPPVSAPTGSPASLQLVVLVDICDGDTDGVPATEADRGTQVRTRLAAGRWREADEAAAIAEAWARGDREAAERAVSDELIDAT